MELLISLLSGAVGGNAAGATTKKSNLGPIWNTLAGAAGALITSGAVTGLIQNLVQSSIGNVVGSAAAGAIAVYIVKFVKGLVSKQASN